MFLLALLIAGPSISLAIRCEASWTHWGGYCYRHFNTPAKRVTFDEAQAKCKADGAELARYTSHAELLWAGKFVHLEGWKEYNDLPLIGFRKGQYDSWDVKYNDEYPPHAFEWCGNLAGDTTRFLCMVVVGDDVRPTNRKAADGCTYAVDCNLKYSRFLCKKQAHIRKPVVCKNPNTEVVNGTCVCKKDYIDITETDVPERKTYKKGEKCIPKNPCKKIKDFTINFIVDASHSIQEENWKKLVQFLQSGADHLPTTTRVGFIKFATNVSFSGSLDPNWNKKKYRKFVPKEFDDGQTHTFDGIDAALALFKKHKTKRQVAVLITDGMPFTSDTDTPEIPIKKTREAVQKLHDAKIPLVILGYGPDLTALDHQKELMSWVKRPKQDYFAYDKLACDLKSQHMCILMQKVCYRYVKK